MAATEALYSNSQVKKAGKYWAKVAQAFRADPVAAMEAFDAAEILRTNDIIAWWRAQHAYPLTVVGSRTRRRNAAGWR